ncbi:hypothetical protein N9B82_06745 [Saprospiraceae bacterium]|nr:hypothetical protein [Saprospiraceae bacterium]
MKLLFTLLCLLSSTFSWAVFYPSSTSLIDSCEVLELTTGEKLLVQVNRVENDNIYFHLCGETDYPERKLQMRFIESWDKSQSAVDKIRKQNAEDAEIYANQNSLEYCEKLVFINQTELLVYVIRVDSTFLYYRPCYTPDSPERTVKLSFIKSRLKTNSTTLSLVKQQRVAEEIEKKSKWYYADQPSEIVILEYVLGFVLGYFITELILYLLR